MDARPRAMHERSRDEAAGGVETTPPPPPLPPQPSSSSSKRGAYFLGATVPADGDEDDEQETFPASPALDQSGSSSIVQAVSSIRRTFSESVLDVEPPQVSLSGLHFAVVWKGEGRMGTCIGLRCPAVSASESSGTI